MQKQIKAKEIQRGDVIRDPEHGPFSVKDVTHITNPVTRTLEIKIRGPLSILVKFDAEKVVTVYRR